MKKIIKIALLITIGVVIKSALKNKKKRLKVENLTLHSVDLPNVEMSLKRPKH